MFKVGNMRPHIPKRARPDTLYVIIFHIPPNFLVCASRSATHESFFSFFLQKFFLESAKSILKFFPIKSKLFLSRFPMFKRRVKLLRRNRESIRLRSALVKLAFTKRWRRVYVRRCALRRWRALYLRRGDFLNLNLWVEVYISSWLVRRILLHYLSNFLMEETCGGEEPFFRFKSLWAILEPRGTLSIDSLL